MEIRAHSAPLVSSLKTYAVHRAGLGVATILPDFDYETYSDLDLKAVGSARYSEHASTEVLSLAYDLKDDVGPRLWMPGQPNPSELFNYLAEGGLLEAHNSGFEYQIWNNVCVRRYGWPRLHLRSLRCSQAKARAFGLPGALEKLAEVLKLVQQKDKRGKTLIKKFCSPRKPTINNPTTRNFLNFKDKDTLAFLEYNIQDIRTESAASKCIPDLNPFELMFWQYDQIINQRGVCLDIEMMQCCINIIEQAYEQYNKELQQLTNGSVDAITKVAQLKSWMTLTHFIKVDSLDENNVVELLKRPALALPQTVRRVLEIRQLIGGSAVKKLYTMREQVCKDGRLRNLFEYHGARTGRAAGRGIQPQNFPKEGPAVDACPTTGRYYIHPYKCVFCGTPKHLLDKKIKTEWNSRAAEHALETISVNSLEQLTADWGDSPLSVVSGCLRGLLIAAPNHDLICSDYSAIEAVVLSALAGEEWRMEVFRTHGKIYEMSAAKISGTSFEQIIKHKDDTGQHHPLRGTIGKVAELASGFGGWIGSWKQFGANDFFDDEQIKQAVLKWREESPNIVEFWGGQFRKYVPEFYGIEGAAIQAIMSPGKEYSYRGIVYVVHDNVLYCKLLSGRYLTYHNPRLRENNLRPGLAISFDGWNSNESTGAAGWQSIDTYGGKLVENIVQATARDILANAIINLERAGYPVVLHIHDEIVAEVPRGTGSLEEFEQIMAIMPDWAKDWPIKAKGGWRGKRYRKD